MHLFDIGKYENSVNCQLEWTWMDSEHPVIWVVKTDYLFDKYYGLYWVLSLVLDSLWFLDVGPFQIQHKMSAVAIFTYYYDPCFYGPRL